MFLSIVQTILKFYLDFNWLVNQAYVFNLFVDFTNGYKKLSERLFIIINCLNQKVCRARIMSIATWIA